MYSCVAIPGLSYGRLLERIAWYILSGSMNYLQPSEVTTDNQHIGFRHLEDDHPRLKEECDHWINIAIFMARGAAGGMANGKRPFSCEWDKYARHDIETCLEKELLPGTKKNCEVTVVAQYVLLAGSGLYERNVLKPEDGSKEKALYLKKCQMWTSKFKQLLQEYEVEGKLKLAAMTKEAYEKMVALQSQLEPSLD
jgi:hypothetical protein